jgi:hypothetical protein
MTFDFIRAKITAAIHKIDNRFPVAALAVSALPVILVVYLTFLLKQNTLVQLIGGSVGALLIALFLLYVISMVIREQPGKPKNELTSHSKTILIIFGICLLILGAVAGWSLHSLKEEKSGTPATKNGSEAKGNGVKTTGTGEPPSSKGPGPQQPDPCGGHNPVAIYSLDKDIDLISGDIGERPWNIISFFRRVYDPCSNTVPSKDNNTWHYRVPKSGKYLVFAHITVEKRKSDLGPKNDISLALRTKGAKDPEFGTYGDDAIPLPGVKITRSYPVPPDESYLHIGVPVKIRVSEGDLLQLKVTWCTSVNCRDNEGKKGLRLPAMLNSEEDSIRANFIAISYIPEQ